MRARDNHELEDMVFRAEKRAKRFRAVTCIRCGAEAMVPPGAAPICATCV
jgi:hypothetical protein